MINIVGNLFEQQGWLCITTNGFVKNNGRAVMGAGCAKTVRDAVPDIDLALGKHIKQRGNVVGSIGSYMNNPVFSFPVKHNWWENADLELIAQSATLLRDMWYSVFDGVMPENVPNVWIPRPGCGNGKLSYKDVEPVLQAILLEDNFKIITF
jgi:hypothetical protein